MYDIAAQVDAGMNSDAVSSSPVIHFVHGLLRLNRVGCVHS